MPEYNAEISAGSLMPLESKRIAVLLLTEPDDTAWRDAIEVQNILQKKTPATARRQATLIRKRLMTLDAKAWDMIATREGEVVNQLLLAASVKHSLLLGDFLRNVYADRQRRLETKLLATDWQDFLAECAHHDAAVANWTEGTKAKLFQVIVRILVEAKYLENVRTMKLTPQSLHPDVERYLRKHHESYVLQCLERAQ
jgi:L-alanine-DL-glutamate epimerase-like enolase superfamily enzyme